MRPLKTGTPGGLSARRPGGWVFNRPAAVLAMLLLSGGRLRAAPLPGARPLIQIGVEVVEVDEQKTRRLGIRWLDQLHIQEADVPALLKVGTMTRQRVFADIQALLEQGAANLLANPKLVTRDGTTASFHAGGELPYAVAGSLGTASVEFKPYGVNLKINPQLETGGRVAMNVDAEVSGLDEQNSVSLAGNTVPGLRTRRVNSQLLLSPGSTLTMAGLIQNHQEVIRRGIPGLMHIPVLGYLFSHRSTRHRRTSVVVFVTPTILEGENAQAPVRVLQPPHVVRQTPAIVEPYPVDEDLPELPAPGLPALSDGAIPRAGGPDG